jgi:regulator of sigma E protease
MEIVNSILYLLITIGVLVFVHEFGHFAAAKLFGMRVERFSVGFPPRAFGKKIGETDYCVSYIPIGGYVKISGMIDESFDASFAGRPPEPWEFRSKPIWQRMVVISAGVVMNVILAYAIFSAVIFFQGKTVLATTQVGSVRAESVLATAGLQSGDRILAINGSAVSNWNDIATRIFGDHLGEDLAITVERAGSTLDLHVPSSSVASLADAGLGIAPQGSRPAVVQVSKDSPAQVLGLEPGDVILSVGGEAVDYGSLSPALKRHPSTPVEIVWTRGQDTLRSVGTPTSEGMIGIGLSPFYDGPLEQQQFSVTASLGEGGRELWQTSTAIVRNVYAIVVGSISLSESVGGPIKIAQIATRSAEAGIASFVTVMAWLSLSLAFLNILPFPALDGGHLVFLVVEGIIGREISIKVKSAIIQAGIIVLIMFMVFVMYNDIRGL